jgi:hypothetical protein
MLSGANFRTKIRTTQNLRTKILALGVALCATPVAASQPIWQPAIYCAALDFTRAALLTHAEGDVPDWVGTPESAAQSGRAYLRIAAEALDCPTQDVLAGYLRNAELSLRHRMEVAISYGVDREVMVLPIASEAELVCAINFAPEVLAAARAAEATDPPRALCPAPQ